MVHKEIIYSDKAPAPSGSYSQAIKLGNMVYVSGTCPFQIGTDIVLSPNQIGEQTKIVLRYISEILRSAGTSLDNVVKVTSFINELNDFKQYNEAYSAFFQEIPPARSTIEIVKLPPGMCVEIECIAYIP